MQSFIKFIFGVNLVLAAKEAATKSFCLSYQLYELTLATSLSTNLFLRKKPQERQLDQH